MSDTSSVWNRPSSTGLGSLLLLVLIGILAQQKWSEPSEPGEGTEMTLLNSEMLVLVAVQPFQRVREKGKFPHLTPLEPKSIFIPEGWDFSMEIYSHAYCCASKGFSFGNRRGQSRVWNQEMLSCHFRNLYFFSHGREFNHLRAIITQDIYAQGNTKAELW